MHTFRAVRQAKGAAGNFGVAVFRDAGLAFWTRTMWSDEAAMRSFMRSGAHRQVMPHLARWCDEAALAHWVQDMPEPPTWGEAHRRLQQRGRRSRVDHPSAAQLRFEIPAPKTGGG